MPIFKYDKTVIYSIDCKDLSVKYFFVGFTTNFIKSKYRHKCKTIEGKDEILYNNINNNGGWNNWIFTVLEKCNCNNRNEIIEKTKQWEHFLGSTKIAPKLHQDNTKFAPKTPNLHQICTKITPKNDEIIILENKCNYCNKIFTRSTSLRRHELNRCKVKQNQESNQLILQQQRQTNNSLIPAFGNDNQLQNSNNNNSNNRVMNNSNNSVNNNTVNNTINIVPLGKEDLVNFFTNEQQIFILNKMFGSFIYLIESVHVSGKYPQFQNISITNLRSNVGYSFDEKKQTFIAQKQTDLLASLIDIRLDDIRDFLENVKDSLNQKVIEKIESLISEVEEQQEKYWDRIKHTLYNGRNEVDIRKKCKQDLLNANKTEGSTS